MDNNSISYKHWKEILNHLPVIIFETDITNKLTYLSDNISKILGYGKKDLLGKSAIELFHEEDRKQLLENIKKKLSKNDSEAYHYRIKRKSGTYATVILRSTALWKNGKPTGLLGIGLDISKSEALKKQLADSENRYRSLFINAGIGIYRTTPEGEVITVNPAMLEILGCDSAEELTGRNFIKKQTEAGYSRNEFKSLLEKEGEISGYESVWKRKDGKKIWIRENAVAIKDKTGKTLFYDGTIEDITFQKQADFLLQKQQHLSLISEQMAKLGSWEEDLETGTVIWSPEEYRIFEIPQGTIPSEELFFSKIHPADKQKLMVREKLLSSRSGKIELEYRIIANGKVKWIRSIMDSHRNKKGKVSVLFGVDMDITRQKEQEEQLIRQKNLLEQAQEIGKIGSWELDIKTNKVYASPQLASMYGVKIKDNYSLEDFTKQIYPADIKDRGIARGKWDVLKKGTFDSTYRIVINNNIKWINAKGKVLYSDTGEPLKIIAAVQDITRQKQNEEELKNLERQKTALLNAIPDMILLVDKEGIILDYIEGKDVKEKRGKAIIGKKLIEIYPYKEARRRQAILQESITKGVIFSEILTMQFKENTRHFEVNISPVDDNKAVVSVRDVTVKEDTHREILKYNEQLMVYAKALEESPVSIVITDAKATIEYVNKHITKDTGYSAEELIGKYTRIFKSGYHDNNFYAELWETLLSGKTWKGEFFNKKKNGELYWESALISPIKNKSGNIIHFVAVKEDITRRKKEYLLLQERAAIVNSSNAIILSKDLNGIITSWNRGAEKVYGYKEEEMIGMPINIIIPPSLKKELNEFTKSIAEGKIIEDFQTKRICKNGKEVAVSLNLTGVKNEKGEITGIAVVGHDITKQKQLEKEITAAKEKAEESTRIKSLFLANISHEIRTPLNAILGFSDILSKRVKDPVERDYVNSMQSSGKALLSLVNDLLDLSKAEAGKMELNLQTTDIRFLVHDIKSIFRLKANRKHLDFKIIIDKDIPKDLFIDELKIRQILLNLTSNAIKFTEKGFVKITVKAINIEEDTTDLILEVKDSGKGIPSQYHKKIFNLFEQEDEEISSRYGGTGLGLSITNQIVTQMHGKIELESEEGKGSTFRVILPNISMTGEKPAKKTFEKEVETPIVYKPATILIVDDTENNRKVLRGFMEDFPFTILEAEDGNIALKKLSENKPDLVFMDIRMPGMDGITAVKKIRENEEWSHLPVVALTASSSEYEGRKLKDKGFTAYLRKPASPKQIEKTLQEFLPFSTKAEEKSAPLTAKTKENIEAIYNTLQEKVIPLQKELLGIKPRRQVNELARVIINTGKSLSSEEVKRYGEKLLSANTNFQITKEKELIDNLPFWIEQLKKRAQED